MTRQDLPKTMMSILNYGLCEEMNFEAMADECGYQRKTTFYNDLSIAECYGVKGIRETYDNVVRNWLNDVVYFTEFVMALNWKSWCWDSRGDDEFTLLYIELYEKAAALAYETFKDEDLTYFVRTID